MIPGDIKTLHNLPKKTYLDYIKLFPVTQRVQIKSYLTLILTLSAVIVFSLFAISPTVNTIIELRKQLDDSQFANDELSKKITALDSLQNQYFSFGQTLEQINEVIPTIPEVPKLFAKIQTLAADNQVEVITLESKEVELTKKTAAKVPSSFTFVVTIAGPYAESIAFLDSLQNFNRAVTIESISVERNAQKSGLLETTVTARAYFHSEAI